MPLRIIEVNVGLILIKDGWIEGVMFFINHMSETARLLWIIKHTMNKLSYLDSQEND